MKSLSNFITESLHESVLDPDFANQANSLDVIGDFTNGLQKFVPKTGIEAFEYWWAMERAFYYIFNLIDEHNTVHNNVVKLHMLNLLVTLVPEKIKAPYWDEDEEEWTEESGNNEWLSDLVLSHVDDIKQNKFMPWASTRSSGGLMCTFFDACPDPDPNSLPENLPDGFDHKRYHELSKKLYNLAVSCLRKLKA